MAYAMNDTPREDQPLPDDVTSRARWWFHTRANAKPLSYDAWRMFCRRYTFDRAFNNYGHTPAMTTRGDWRALVEMIGYIIAAHKDGTLPHVFHWVTFGE